MKRTFLVINSIIVLAVVVLYILHFTEKRPKSDGADCGTETCHRDLSVAYIKMDSVIIEFEFAQVLNAELLSKQEAYNEEYKKKRIAFDEDAATFQEKVERGGFITPDRAIRERNRLINIEQEIIELDHELSNKLAEYQKSINQQILDSISVFMKDYNEEKNYDLILNSAALLQGSEFCNITQEITKGLNERFPVPDMK